MTPSPLITLAEVRAMFRVSANTLRKMRRSDPNFPQSVAVSERPIKFRKSEITQYLENR